MPVEQIVCKDKQSWLLERMKGVGSSDAACILGVNPWQSAVSLYADKLGVETGFQETERMKWGNRLEEPIAQAFAEETKREVRDPGRFTIVRNSDYPFAHATPDRGQVDLVKGHGILEIKTTNIFKKEEWDEEPPLFYQIQLQHQLMVTGLSWGSICVLIGGQELRWQDQVRNDAFIAVLAKKEAEFWACLQASEPPAASEPWDASVKALKALYPEDSGDTIELDEACLEWYGSLERAKAEIKWWEGEQKEADAKLRHAIGEATFARLPNGLLLSLKTTHNPGYTVKPFDFRALRKVKG